MSINSGSGALTFNSAPDYETKSSYSATVTASDGTNSATQDITVSVTNVNDNTPSITSGNTFSAAENQTAIGTVTATDADGDTLSYSIASVPGSNTNNAFPQNDHPSLDETDYYVVSPTSGQSISLKVYNIDYTMSVSLKNSSGGLEQQFSIQQGSTTTIPVSDYLSPNGSTIDLELTNPRDGFTFTWELSVADQVVHSNGCGVSGSKGCADNSQTSGVVYQSTIYLGPDSSDISINSSTGALTFDSAPDYETKASYTATVAASDGTNSATQDITVNVTDVQE
jgi:serralysin